MRFFITGISGFAGSHLADLLLERGHDVTGIARDSGSIGDLHRRHGERFPTSAVELCDVRDPVRLREALRRGEPDGVFHLAAVAFVPHTFDRPSLAYEVNFLGTVELLSAVGEVTPRARVVLVTSGEVYGSIDVERDLPITESQPLRPLSPYSLAKAAADLAGFQAFASRSLDVVRARPFNHTGPRQAPDFVCSEFARALAAAERGLAPRRLRVGNLDVERDFSDVRDVVRGYFALFEKGVSGEAYNLGSGKATSVRDVLESLRRKCRVKVDVETDPQKLRPREISRLFGSIAKIEAATRWCPEISLEQTLADLLDYWRTQVVR
jgi:GDP-4-dehydro-6-deoxy-D-mannose reductase